jgi:endonuclease/exonuclease/phosphatase family metal-dependent hydrolase
MTKLSLLAYNTRTGFGDDVTCKKLIDLIKSFNPDIAFFSDALPQRISKDKLAYIKNSLSDLGYDILVSDTERTDRTDWTRSMGISKQALNAKHFYGGLRNETYNVELGGKIITGRHFDDRNESNRLQGIDDLEKVDVVMGDFNAMYRNTLIAHTLHILMPIGNSFKDINTDVSIVKNPLLRAVSLFQRFTRMSDGKMLNELKSFGFVETNKNQIPTMHRIAQLDHILVKPRITFLNFKVHKNVGLSDHKPISVDIKFS